jgi:hypothetical protein
MKVLIPVAFGILIAASGGCVQALPASNLGSLTWATVVNTASPEAQTARARRRLAQYCVPADEDSDAPRVYCRNGPGKDSIKALGAASFPAKTAL